MNGYDQWRTASPYDDYNDDICPRCGADYNSKDIPEFSDADQETEWYTDGFCSQVCFGEYDKDCNYDNLGVPRYRRITKEQIDHVYSLQDRARLAMDEARKAAKEKPITIGQLFEYTPDGDFCWDDTEAGDWHVYSCGEKDCPIGWHLVAHGMNISRKNDKKKIDLWSVDSGGNWDFDTGWESGEDASYILEEISMQMSNYFYGWFDYWTDCACTGQDVLDQADDTHKSVTEYIKFAEDSLKYLEM